MDMVQDPWLAPEDLLRLTAENVPIVLFTLDNQGVIQLSFGKSLAIWSNGRPSLGQSIYDLYPDQPEMIGYFERARTGESFSAMIETADLGIVFDTRFEPLRAPDGTIQGVVGVAIDQTQRVQAERALQRQNSYINLLYEITRAANTSRTLDEAITYTLERVCQVLGWPLGHAYLGSEQTPGRLIPSSLWYSRELTPFQDFIRATEGAAMDSGQGLAGHVFGTKQPYFISNPRQQMHILRGEAAAEAGIQTAVAFPVMVGEEAVAVLEFFSTDDLQPDEHLLELGKDIGTQIGRVVERVRAQRALHSSEDRFYILVKSVEEYAIVILDPDGRVSSWNGGAEAIKGYREQEILGKHLSIFYPPEARAEGLPEKSLLIARQAGRYEYEGWLVRKGGERFWANVNMTPMYSEDGTLVGFARVSRDMTRRKQIEDALLESEISFRAIFEGSALGIELVDLEGRLLAYNLSILRIFGYPRAELDQAILTGQEHPVNIVVNSLLFDELRSGKRESYSLERPYRHADGHLIWCRTTVSRVGEARNSPRYAIAMLEDITERKQMESEVAEMARRLLEGGEADRLHLAQELHDGPVQDLYGLTYHLRNLERQPGKELAAGLSEAQTIARKVIDTLRSISGELRPPTLAPFGLEKAIASHARAFQEAHPELKLNLDLRPDRQDLPENIRLALFRIYQASLTNVLRHARANQVEVRFSYDEQQASLDIRDDGDGFVVPLRWIDLAREGHLGLVSAKERAQAVGGRFEIESAPGNGTHVRVIIPLQDGQLNKPFAF